MRILLFAISLLVFPTLLAQKGELNFGPKVGMMFGAPIPHGEAPEGAKGSPLIGPNIGLFFSYYFSENWSLWVEGNYNRKAAEFRTPLVDQEYEDDVTIVTPDGTAHTAFILTVFNGESRGKFDNYYFEIPILLRYNIGKKWRLLAGPYFASLAKSESFTVAEGYVGASDILTVEERNLVLDMANQDVGAIMGFHYRHKPLIVDFRLSYGFTSIFRKDYTLIDYPLRNVFAQLSVGFEFARVLGQGNQD
jgi:hypothetical protein